MSDPLSVKRADIEDVTVTLNNGVLAFEFRHADGVDEFSINAPLSQRDEAVSLIRTWQEEAVP